MARKESGLPENKLLPALQAKECISRCGRPNRTLGFCGVCYPKFLKGYFLADGRIHPEAAAKNMSVNEKEIKKANSKKKKAIKEDREMLKAVLDRRLLSILADKHPAYAEPFGCPIYNFWVSKDVCFNRLYLLERKQCKKCTVHDDEIPFLKDFISTQLAEEQS